MLFAFEHNNSWGFYCLCRAPKMYYHSVSIPHVFGSLADILSMFYSTQMDIYIPLYSIHMLTYDWGFTHPGLEISSENFVFHVYSVST